MRRRGVSYDGWDYVVEPVRDLREEGECSWCGCPQYVGDRVYWLETGDTYCSRECLDKAHPGRASTGGDAPWSGRAE